MTKPNKRHWEQWITFPYIFLFLWYVDYLSFPIAQVLLLVLCRTDCLIGMAWFSVVQLLHFSSKIRVMFLPGCSSEPDGPGYVSH